MSNRSPFTLSKTSALLLCIGITLIVMLVELIYSSITGSMMLFSDGIHMLTHSASLGISLLAIFLAKKYKNSKIELIAATVNGLGLIGFSVYIIIESYYRFVSDEPILAGPTIIVALIGLATNLLTAWILAKSKAEDLNTKSALLHMLADTISSVAIIAGGIIIYFTDWLFIDAILSVVVALVVGKWSIDLLRKSLPQILRGN